jgi:hypothetical protein
MLLMRVVYRDKDHDFDYVTCDRLNMLIMHDEITHFFRPSERKWVNIRLDPVRGNEAEYQGPERRGAVNNPKSIEVKGRINEGASYSDWLEGLWRQVEGHDALG